MYKPVFSCDMLRATGFLQRSAVCHHGLKWGAKYKISIHKVHVNLSKTGAFKGMISKFCNVVAAQIG
jgi:hypothetical protein